MYDGDITIIYEVKHIVANVLVYIPTESFDLKFMI